MSVRFNPHPYQQEVIEAMRVNQTFALLLDPGMGKTAICLKDFCNKRLSLEAERALVVAPLRTCYSVWPKETKKWQFSKSIDVYIAHGKGRKINETNAAEFVVINPEGLKWMVDNAKKLAKFDVVYVDESTMFKNSQAKRTRNLYKLCHKLKGGIANRYILTGTPAPNGVADLFGQFKILDARILGDTLQKFRGDFAFSYHQSHWGGEWTPTPKSEELIQQAISPYSIRLDATDHLDLPDMVKTRRMVKLPPDVRKVYDELAKELYASVKGGEVMAVNSAVMTGKCRQIANGAVYLTQDGEATTEETQKIEYLHQEKAKELIALYEELGRKPLLVAYEYGHDLTTIKQAIKKEYGFTPRYIGETTSREADDELIDQWNNRDLPMLLINPAGASHGLNLQAGGHHICWYSMTWNLEHYLQFNGRLWRQGQMEGVFIHHLLAERTIDERVWDVVGRKDATQNKLMVALKKGI